MDPSGTFLQYDAKAIGSGSEGAQQSLQEVYHKVSLRTECELREIQDFCVNKSELGLRLLVG